MDDEFPNVAAALLPLVVPIDSVEPDPANAREHNSRNIETIKASLARFGQQKPIVLAANGKTIIAGNGMWAAAKELGWSSIAVVHSHLKDTDATAYGIADNRTAELAEWSDNTLGALLSSLQSADMEAFAAAGFTDEEFGDLMDKINRQGTPPDGEAPSDPALVSECLVEIRCTRDALNEIAPTLQGWNERDDVAVDIS